MKSFIKAAAVFSAQARQLDDTEPAIKPSDVTITDEPPQELLHGLYSEVMLYDQWEQDLLVATLKAAIYIDDGALFTSYYLEMHNDKVLSDETFYFYREDEHRGKYHLQHDTINQKIVSKSGNYQGDNP